MRWRRRSRRPPRPATAPRTTSCAEIDPQDRRDQAAAPAAGGRTTVENDATQISLAEAQRRNPAASIGDQIAESLPPIDFGRIAAQNAKQVIVQKVRDAERDRMYAEYKDRIGEIVNGAVKRVEYGNVIVDLGRGEGIIRRDEIAAARDLPPRRPRARLRL